MGKDLHDLAENRGIEADNSWTRIAFNEILGTIYHSQIEESELDELIEKMASIVIKELGIEEDELDWQKVEEWQYKEAYNLVTYDYYLDFDEAKKIICKSKISSDYDWEDISSNAMNIDEINQKMIKSFKDYIEDYKNTDKEYMKKFIEKGIYIDFRQGDTK